MSLWVNAFIIAFLTFQHSLGQKFKIPSNEPKNKIEWSAQAKKTVEKLKGII